VHQGDIGRQEAHGIAQITFALTASPQARTLEESVEELLMHQCDLLASLELNSVEHNVIGIIVEHRGHGFSIAPVPAIDDAPEQGMNGIPVARVVIHGVPRFLRLRSAIPATAREVMPAWV